VCGDLHGADSEGEEHASNLKRRDLRKKACMKRWVILNIHYGERKRGAALGD
jgi:hypothetical protein